MSNSSFGLGKLILQIQGMKFFLLSSTGIGIFLLLLKGICRLLFLTYIVFFVLLLAKCCFSLALSQFFPTIFGF